MARYRVTKLQNKINLKHRIFFEMSLQKEEEGEGGDGAKRLKKNERNIVVHDPHFFNVVLESMKERGPKISILNEYTESKIYP